MAELDTILSQWVRLGAAFNAPPNPQNARHRNTAHRHDLLHPRLRPPLFNDRRLARQILPPGLPPSPRGPGHATGRSPPISHTRLRPCLRQAALRRRSLQPGRQGLPPAIPPPAALQGISTRLRDGRLGRAASRPLHAGPPQYSYRVPPYENTQIRPCRWQ